MEDKVPYILPVNINKMQILALIFSILLLSFIVGLIRNKKIKEEYSILWLFVSFVFITFSIWREGLDYVSFALGVAYPPAALFLILLMAAFLIMIQFSMIISKQAENFKSLAQDTAIIKKELEDSKREIKQLKKEIKRMDKSTEIPTDF